MKMLYDYCAKCGRRIEVGNHEIVYNTYCFGEAVTFCGNCIQKFDVDAESGIEIEKGGSDNGGDN